MEEKSMIPVEEIKERKVEIVKDIHTPTIESEKEIAEKIKQKKEERKFLIQLIVIFCTWVFLIILLMRSERVTPKAPSPPKPANPPSNNMQQKANIPNTPTPKPNPTPSSKSLDHHNKPPNASPHNKREKK